MKLRSGAFVVLVALAVMLVPAAALADTYRSADRMASAYAVVGDPEAPEMLVGVSAGTQAYSGQMPKQGVDKGVMDSADVWIDWNIQEPVDGSAARFAFLSLAPYDAGIDRGLTTAAVHADLEGMLIEGTWSAIAGEEHAFELVDAVETPITGRADFDWVGAGSLVPYKYRMQDWGFGYRIFDRFAGKYRPATVTGSLLIDGIELPEDLEFTGEISQSKSMTIIHGDFPEPELFQ